MFNKKEFHQLEDKSILKISGGRQVQFIQGIISNDVEILKKKFNLFIHALTSRKIYIDFFYQAINDFLLLEVNEEQKMRF